MKRIWFGTLTVIAVLGAQCTVQEDDIRDEGLRYLALGDSYTIGESVAPTLRWPVQLVDSLNSRGLQVDPATILATTGWTTADLLEGIEATQPDTIEWDLVSLLIGVNNQYQGLSIQEYAMEFDELLDRAIAMAGGRPDRVFVVSIPDYGYTPFGQSNQSTISAKLMQFNDTCRVHATARGIAHYPITDISQGWPEQEGLVAADGLHPSGWQYGLWVSSFVDEVANQLND